MAAGAAYLRALTDAGLDRRRGRRAWSSSATPPPTSSSRRSPSCAPPAGCGPGCSSSAAAERARRQRQHAVTSRPMMSKYDPWVNMLRTTVAAFAAGVGGADAVTVLPFDSPLGVPDAFGRRIARNTSHLLIDESHVAAGRRPGRRRVRRREAHRRPRRARRGSELGRLEDGGGDLRRSTTDRRRPVGARASARGRHAASARSPGSPSSRTSPRRCPSAAPTRDGDDVRRYGAAFEALRDEPAAQPGLPRHAGHRRRSTPPARPSPPTCSPPAASPSTSPGRPTASTTCSRRTTASRSSASPAPTRRTPSGAPTRSPRCARPAPTHVIVAGKADRLAPTTPARWASTRSTS